MKNQSIILTVCAALILSACFQESATSPMASSAVSAASLPNEPSKEAKIIKEILVNTAHSQRVMESQLKKFAQLKQPEPQARTTLQEIFGTHAWRTQRDLENLQKLNPKDVYTQAMQTDLIKRLEVMIPIFKEFSQTGKFESLLVTDDLTQQDIDLKIDLSLSIELRFEAQFVKQPEILLETATLLDGMYQLVEITNSNIKPVDKSLPKHEKLNVIIDFVTQQRTKLQVLESYFQQLKLMQPNTQQLRDEYILLIQAIIKNYNEVIQRAREGKREKTKQEREGEKQIEKHFEKINFLLVDLWEMVEKERINLK